MVEEKVTLDNEIGLHARPASRFIREAIKYKSKIEIIKDEKIYNGKSIMGILSMGATCGDELLVRASGEDEEEAVKNLTRFLEFELGDRH